MNPVESLKEELEKDKVQAFLITHQVNVLYLSGFSGSWGAILITRDKPIFLTDSRYEEQAVKEVTSHTFEIEVLKPGEKLSDALKGLGIESLAIEGSLTLNQYFELKAALPEVEMKVWKRKVEDLRKIKTEKELRIIKNAVKVAEKGFQDLLPTFAPGITEKEFALELEHCIRLLGAESAAFPYIVASGKRSSMPHGTATEKVIEEDDLVLIDFGALYSGYHSDISRTLKLSDKWRDWEVEMFQVTLDAQNAAFQKIEAGIPAREVDRASRAVMERWGYGRYFGHGLGHGVGLEIHEAPTLGPNSKDILEIGMIFTLEPGIYLPGKGGVRIEDMVYLGENGPEFLTTLERKI